MQRYRAILCAVSLAIVAGAPAFGAEKKPEAKPAAAKKPEAKPAADKKSEAKPAAAAKPEATLKPLRGRTETLACRLGTEDRHARIAVVLIGGKTDSFAYYSKWKPRTCSIYLQRLRDPYSKWAETGNITTVNLEKGAFLIEHKKNEYHFIFRDIDRERYCGMDGVINGSLTIKKGSDQCILDGEIMVEGTPLGEAAVVRRTPEELIPSAGASDVEQSSAGPAGAAASPVQKPTPASAQKPIPPATQTTAPPATQTTAPPAAQTTAPPVTQTTAPASPEKAAPTPTPSIAPATAPAASADQPAASGNPFSAFFRSIAPGRPAEEQSRPD